MMIFGLLLVGVGAAGLIVSYFGADIDNEHRSAELLNWDISPGTLVLWGAISTLILCFGLWVMKYGAKQGLKHRKERKQLNELSDKLDRAEREKLAENLSDDD